MSKNLRIERIAKLVAHPSVSSAAPGWDQSKRAVIDELASWLDDAGFAVQVLPLAGAPGKADCVRGSGPLYESPLPLARSSGSCWTALMWRHSSDRSTLSKVSVLRWVQLNSGWIEPISAPVPAPPAQLPEK